MSAIFGVHHWDGGAVQPNDLQIMGDALQYRGDNPPKTWMARSVGFGNVLLATTLEAKTATLPYSWQEAGLCITADARIDNREILIERLGAGSETPANIPDSALILRAYEKWGESCPEKLLGDFAFAIWDERKQTLFCARDHFGVRPFYYHQGAGTFTFASDFAALVQLPRVPCDINRQRIADFLAGISEDTEATYYTHIRKLLPAHALSVQHEGAARTSRYYQLADVQELRLKDDEAYAEAFREKFFQAVRRRVNLSGPTACMLSGGLDSSAIVCVAARLRRQGACGPITTFSNTYAGFPECDESAYIQSVLDQDRYDSRLIPVDAARTFNDLENTVKRVGEPTYAMGLFGSGDLYGVVHAAGMNVVLDGHGGDEVISEGQTLLRELADQNRWFELALESMLIAKVYGEPFLPGLMRLLSNHGLTAQIRQGVRLRSRLRGLRPPAPSAPQEQTTPQWAAPMHPDFLVETQQRKRRAEWRAKQPEAVNDTRLAHLRVLNHTGQGSYFEQLNRSAAANGVEPRYPFWDKDLVEFCLRLPTKQKLRRGWVKVVMRRGLRGILPDPIRRRRDKIDFSAQLAAALRSLSEDDLRALLLDSEVGKSMVSSKWYEDAITQLFQCKLLGGTKLAQLLWCISLLTWLKTSSQKNCR